MSNIRLASTILLLRQIKSTCHVYQIYSIKRPDTMKFLPGFTAFPGGALEEQDYIPEWKEYRDDALRSHDLLPLQQTSTGELLESPIDTNDPQSNSQLPYVHRIAALRELFEETGILMGRTRNDRLPIVLSVVNNKSLGEYRNALINQKITFLDVVRACNVTLDTQSLLYIGKRLTPPSKPIRFDTQFFLTFVEEDIVSAPLPGEIAGDDWLEPTEALIKIKSDRIQCAPPTIECFSILARELKQHEFIQQFYASM